MSTHRCPGDGSGPGAGTGARPRRRRRWRRGTTAESSAVAPTRTRAPRPPRRPACAASTSAGPSGWRRGHPPVRVASPSPGPAGPSPCAGEGTPGCRTERSCRSSCRPRRGTRAAPPLSAPAPVRRRRGRAAARRAPVQGGRRWPGRPAGRALPRAARRPRVAVRGPDAGPGPRRRRRRCDLAGGPGSDVRGDAAGRLGSGVLRPGGDVEDAPVGSTQVQHRRPPLDLVGLEPDGLAGLGHRRVERVAVGDGLVEAAGEDDGGPVGDLELHGDHGGDALVDQALRGARVGVGAAAAGTLAGVEQAQAQGAVVVQEGAEVRAADRLGPAGRALHGQLPVAELGVVAPVADVVEDVVPASPQLALQLGHGPARGPLQADPPGALQVPRASCSRAHSPSTSRGGKSVGLATSTRTCSGGCTGSGRMRPGRSR
jgi:hypothetical protein